MTVHQKSANIESRRESAVRFRHFRLDNTDVCLCNAASATVKLTDCTETPASEWYSGVFSQSICKTAQQQELRNVAKKKPLDPSVLFLVRFTAWGCLLGVAVDTAHFLNLKRTLDLSELLMGQNRRLGLKRSVCLMSSPTFHPADNSYELLFCSCTVYGSFFCMES